MNFGGNAGKNMGIWEKRDEEGGCDFEAIDVFRRFHANTKFFSFIHV